MSLGPLVSKGLLLGVSTTVAGGTKPNDVEGVGVAARVMSVDESWGVDPLAIGTSGGLVNETGPDSTIELHASRLTLPILRITAETTIGLIPGRGSIPVEGLVVAGTETACRINLGPLASKRPAFRIRHLTTPHPEHKTEAAIYTVSPGNLQAVRKSSA